MAKIPPTHVEPPAHLASTHEQYPDGFPERLDDDLLGHWQTPEGVVVVENHPHGYEVHVFPCYDFEACDACAPDRGPSNPHTPDDGHHFRECADHGPIFTVAGGPEGQAGVLEYLARYGSPEHVEQHAAKLAEEAAAAEALAAEQAAQAEALREENPEPTAEQKLALAEQLLAEAKAELGIL
jgi:hypothetical protein